PQAPSKKKRHRVNATVERRITGWAEWGFGPIQGPASGPEAFFCSWGENSKAKSRLGPKSQKDLGGGFDPGEITTSDAYFLPILGGFHKRGTDPLGSTTDSQK